jgi:squalene-associated FAD-dependent desaturase
MSRGTTVVIGGGLAGITAAIRLAEAGLPVTVLEARPWLGGATCSFARRGLTIDNGQHVFLRCFTAYLGLLARLGVTGSVLVQDRLRLPVLDAGSAREARGGLPGVAPPSQLSRSAQPAPWHLARLLAGYPSLSPAERLLVPPAMLAVWLAGRRQRGVADVSVGDWLANHGQDERSRRLLWSVFIEPILNVQADQADFPMAARMLRTALLKGRGNADIGIPMVPLSELHGVPAARLLGELGADVRLGAKATTIGRDPSGGYTVRFASGPMHSGDHDQIQAAAVVLAVPAWEAAELVPPELAGDAARWARLEPSPIVSVHVVYDTGVTGLSLAVAPGSQARWIFDKTRAAGLRTGQYLTVPLAAAGRYCDVPLASMRGQFLPALEQLFPAAAAARVDDFFVTKERRATFRQAPGTAALRPAQDTGLAAFALAGAWTDTGWPDSMESAVRSGELAARSVIKSLSVAGSSWPLPPAHVAQGAGTLPGAGRLPAGRPGAGRPAAGRPGAGRPAAGTPSPRSPADAGRKLPGPDPAAADPGADAGRNLPGPDPAAADPGADASARP